MAGMQRFKILIRLGRHGIIFVQVIGVAQRKFRLHRIRAERKIVLDALEVPGGRYIIFFAHGVVRVFEQFLRRVFRWGQKEIVYDAATRNHDKTQGHDAQSNILHAKLPAAPDR